MQPHKTLKQTKNIKFVNWFVLDLEFKLCAILFGKAPELGKNEVYKQWFFWLNAFISNWMIPIFYLVQLQTNIKLANVWKFDKKTKDVPVEPVTWKRWLIERRRRLSSKTINILVLLLPLIQCFKGLPLPVRSWQAKTLYCALLCNKLKGTFAQ